MRVDLKVWRLSSDRRKKKRKVEKVKDDRTWSHGVHLSQVFGSLLSFCHRVQTADLRPEKLAYPPDVHSVRGSCVFWLCFISFFIPVKIKAASVAPAGE